MKGFNVRLAVARSMGVIFYFVLIVIACGFIMKLAGGPRAGFEAERTSFSGIAEGIAAFDGDSAFVLAAYISAMSPFIFSAVMFLGYLFQKRYKAALLGFALLCALALALFIKSE